MKVLFLDIDGVLNSQRYFDAESKRAARRAKGKAKASDPASAIDPAAVVLLNQIVERTGVQVVISSSWRASFGLVDIARFLDSRGFTGLICGSTPIGYGVPRGEEIYGWIMGQMKAAHTVEHFAILDDMDDMAMLAPFLVKTDTAIGLQPEHVERCVALFGETP